MIDDDARAVDSEVFAEPLKAVFDAITEEIQTKALSAAKKSQIQDLNNQETANLDREVNSAINTDLGEINHKYATGPKYSPDPHPLSPQVFG